MSVRSDAERLARTRVLGAFVVIYLLCMGFLALGDRLYEGTRYVTWSRLATIPFFLLLLRRWLLLVRVRPPAVLVEARQLAALGKPRAAREKYLAAREALEGSREAARLDRARRTLQGRLAVTARQEALLEAGRCSLLLGELERAVEELGAVHAELPARADVAIDYAEALARSGDERRAGEVLQAAVPQMDAFDRETLREQPSLARLLDRAPPSARASPLARRLLAERAIVALLVAAALAHAARFYLQLF